MKKRLTAVVKLDSEKAIKCASVNFDNVENDTLTLVFNWTNKNTDIESFTKYVKKYLNRFENLKRQYTIEQLTLEEI